MEYLAAKTNRESLPGKTCQEKQPSALCQGGKGPASSSSQALSPVKCNKEVAVGSWAQSAEGLSSATHKGQTERALLSGGI